MQLICNFYTNVWLVREIKFMCIRCIFIKVLGLGLSQFLDDLEKACLIFLHKSKGYFLQLSLTD